MTIKSEDYTHLHVHTEFSTLDGANKTSFIPKYVKETLGQTSLSITDHGNLCGSYKFTKECREANIKPIIGIEAYYTPDDRTLKSRDEYNKAYYHLILIAQNDIGLHNLFKLSSESFKSGLYYKPRIDAKLLQEYNEGIIATTACLGSKTSSFILNNQKDLALKWLDFHKDIFPNRLFLELQMHENEEQAAVNQGLIQLSKETNLPLILTNDTHYTYEHDKKNHEILLKMNTDSVADGFSFDTIDVHLASTEFMFAKAMRQNIPIEALTNTSRLAEIIDSKSYFAEAVNDYPLFKNLPENFNSDQYLSKLVKIALIKKFNGKPPEEYKQRAETELKVIKKMGFSDYMLIQWMHVGMAKNLNVRVGPGRGSAVGSLVAYALEITKIDPIKYGLLFERFLNPGRTAIPKHFHHSHNVSCKH